MHNFQSVPNNNHGIFLSHVVINQFGSIRLEDNKYMNMTINPAMCSFNFENHKCCLGTGTEPVSGTATGTTFKKN
jgi:hypothetical protein